MKKFTKSILVLIGLATSFSASATHLRDQILLSARMNGAQETPSIVTNAVGVTAFSLNSTHDTLCVKMTVAGLSGSITGAHIHMGALGVSGPVLFNLSTFVSGTSAAFIITGNNLTSALLSEYLKGNMYINVHTTANPAGEIRGQIIPESDIQFIADLNGAQETPAVVTNAFALGTFALSKHQGKLLIRIVADGLSGSITGAHLHTGASGVSGPVVVDLTSNISGNTIIASIDPTTILTDLLAGNIYINFHTTANPNGEIRGQLFKDNKIAFDALLNGAQEVPSVNTTATGLANMKLNTTLDTLTYDIVLNGLAGQATGAHIHMGTVGNSGPVIYDMSTGIIGNRISGMATGAALTNSFLSDLLRGNFYVNVHNSTNPNGEIRGQVYRLLREAYSATIDGTQETPSVTTSAMGTAVVTIDRNQTDLHFMIVADGITANGVHFHNGAQGQSGPVIYDITPLFLNNGAFGYWKSSDATPFTTANSMMFRNDSAYVNLHTTANPNGEIRGQIERGFICYTSSMTAINENNFNASVSMYPNPAVTNLHLKINSDHTKIAIALIYNCLGSNIISNSLNTTGIENDINISSLEKGMYFIQIISADGIYTQRFIKE